MLWVLKFFGNDGEEWKRAEKEEGQPTIRTPSTLGAVAVTRRRARASNTLAAAFVPPHAPQNCKLRTQCCCYIGACTGLGRVCQSGQKGKNGRRARGRGAHAAVVCRSFTSSMQLPLAEQRPRRLTPSPGCGALRVLLCCAEETRFGRWMWQQGKLVMKTHRGAPSQKTRAQQKAHIRPSPPLVALSPPLALSLTTRPPNH